MNSPDSQPPKRPLPPHLQFLREYDNFPEDPDEFIAHMRRFIARVQEQRADIRAHGADPDRIIADLKATLAAFEASHAKAESSMEKQLHATADLGDAMREAFRATDALVQAGGEENPFDPKIQEAKEFVDEWRKHVPKE